MWCPHPDTRVQPTTIIPCFDPLEQVNAKAFSVVPLVTVHEFTLDRREERFRRRVVVTDATAAHRLTYPVHLACLAVFVRSVGGTAIGMEDQPDRDHPATTPDRGVE